MASLVVETRGGGKLVIQPGDCFLIEPTLPKHPSRIARIVSLTPTRNPPAEDRIVCVAQIFVSLSETVVFIETEWDPREVFLLPDLQHVDISKISARVEIVYRAPNPDRSDVVEIVSAPFRYYYSWVWNKMENAFVDPPHVEKKLWKGATDVLDLYAGCGGLSYGFDQEGMHVQWAVEWDKAAAKSWVKNHPDGRMFCCSVVDILKFIKAKGPDHEATGWKHIFPEDAYWTQPVEEVFVVRFDETKSIGLEYKVRFKDQDEKKWIAADEVADDVNVRIWKKNNEDKWKPLHKRYREVKRYTDKEEEGGAEAELADAEMALDKQEEDIDEDGNAIEVDSDSEGDGHHLPGGQWKVKEIKDIRINKVGQYEYLVGWEGYSGGDDTWEPEQNIRAGTLIEKFLKTAWTKKMYPCKKTVGYIVGGPPCQGFSKANHHRDSKHPFRGKNRGVSHFLEYVSFFEPRGVLVENVAGMLEHGDGVVPRSVMKQLLLWGYQVRIVMASSACYGVPQRRWRVLIIAAKSGEYLPKLPEPTHWVDTSKWITGSLKPVLRAEWSNIILGPKTSGQPWAKCPDIQQAINDLPPYASVDPKGFSLYNSPPRSNYQKLMRQHVKGNILWNNKGRTSSTVYAWKIYEPTHLFVTITCTLRAMNEPAVHPVYQRPMTAREHARAQSFPDHFHFCGTQGQVYMQIGNAVPCLMARAIARGFITSDKLLCPERTWVQKATPRVTDEDPDEAGIAEMERKFGVVPPLNEIFTEEDYESLQGLRKVGRSKAASSKSKPLKPGQFSRNLVEQRGPNVDSDDIIVEDSSEGAPEDVSADDLISIESEHSDVMSDLHSDNSAMSQSSSEDSISDPEEVLRQLRKEIEKQERRRRGEPSESYDEEDEEFLRTRIYISKAKKLASGSLQSGSDDESDDGEGDWYSKEKRRFSRRRAPIVEKTIQDALKEPKLAVRTRCRARQEKVIAYVIESSSDDELPHAVDGSPAQEEEKSLSLNSKKRKAVSVPSALDASD